MIRMPLASASLLAIAIALAGCGEGKDDKAAAPQAQAPAAASTAAAAPGAIDEAAGKAVVKHYAELVHAVYSDSLSTAKTLQSAIDAFLAKPNDETLKAAKDAWAASRVPYLQSEAFRFGNTIIDDWEGQVNAWPLDEGLIDYVDKSYEHALGNPAASANIIANTEIQVGEDKIDVKDITPRSSPASMSWAVRKPTSPPATTRSNSCSGARISTAPAQARATAQRPTTWKAKAPLAVTTSVAVPTSKRSPTCWSKTSKRWLATGHRTSPTTTAPSLKPSLSTTACARCCSAWAACRWVNWPASA